MKLLLEKEQWALSVFLRQCNLEDDTERAGSGEVHKNLYEGKGNDEISPSILQEPKNNTGYIFNPNDNCVFLKDV